MYVFSILYSIKHLSFLAAFVNEIKHAQTADVHSTLWVVCEWFEQTKRYVAHNTFGNERHGTYNLCGLLEIFTKITRRQFSVMTN